MLDKGVFVFWVINAHLKNEDAFSPSDGGGQLFLLGSMSWHQRKRSLKLLMLYGVCHTDCKYSRNGPSIRLGMWIIHTYITQTLQESQARAISSIIMKMPVIAKFKGGGGAE